MEGQGGCREYKAIQYAITLYDCVEWNAMSKSLHLSHVADRVLLCKLCLYEKSIIKEQ